MGPAYPERSLCLAILRQAVDDAVSSQEVLARQRAWNWLFSNSERPWSFLWVCAMVGGDARRVRRLISWARAGGDERTRSRASG